MTPPVTNAQHVCRHGRDDLVETVIAPASAEAAASTVSDVREERERVSKYLARLKEVRHKRSAMQVFHKHVKRFDPALFHCRASLYRMQGICQLQSQAP